MTPERKFRLVKEADRVKDSDKKSSLQTDDCGTMRLDDLRALVADARRRVNTVVENLDRIDAILRDAVITE
jgi:hypothetical protein